VSARPAAATAGLLAVLVVAGCAGVSAPAAPRGGGWLDRPLAAWNQAGAPVPRPPDASASQAENRERCRAVIRTPVSTADRTVTAAGWWLFGPARTLGATSVVAGSADWDGMCRPSSYQVFVFVGDRFAGTLSPVLMDARTDGAWQGARLESLFHLTAEFLRYSEADPLCCPSRSSEVAYRIDPAVRGPVVVPLAVLTRALPR
jgi:LppP/LprE lipoprotein